MDLPPYQEMPPEVRFRLRGRVLPTLNAPPEALAEQVVAEALIRIGDGITKSASRRAE